MDGDEIEMSEEELQKWIKEEVHKSKLVSPDVLEKCNVLQSHLERREKRAADLLKLCESVAACEAVVQKQYSLLGWDYTDTHSEDDDDKVTKCGLSPQSVCDSDTQDKHPSATYKHSSVTEKLQCSEHLNSNNRKIDSLVLKRKPVVVLTRLPEFQISALCPSTPEEHCSKSESLSSWESEEYLSDSNYSSSIFKAGSKHKRKFDQKHNTDMTKSNTEAKSNVMKTGTFQDNSTSDAKASTEPSPPKASTEPSPPKASTEPSPPKASTEPSPPKASTKPSPPKASTKPSPPKASTKPSPPKASTKPSPPKASTKPSPPKASTEPSLPKASTEPSPPKASTNSNANNRSEKSKTLMPGANRNDKATTKNVKGNTGPVHVTAPCQADGTATKRPLSTPQTEISVDMFVLARRRGMSWQRGQIKEIQTKEDGRVKYKVFFENKGKSLVSGHHIAYDCMHTADQLFVGARVVMERPEDKEFCPGILAEPPNRKNRMRFLVFTDDQKPFYVGLRLIHLVYKPLPDPLDDIINEDQRNFIKEYLKRWPYPPQTQYRVGQIINAELNGTLQTCEVLVVDCSLIHVIFQKTQHKEWLYRGSLRLEHMINMKKTLTSTTKVSH